MSVKVQSMVWDADIEHNQKYVLIALADQANDFGKECWPSIAYLAAKCNLSDRSVQRSLKKLEEDGLISRQARYGRSTYFTIFLSRLVELKRKEWVEVDEDDRQDGARVIHSPDKSSPRQNDAPTKVHPDNLSPPTGNPDSVETPDNLSPPTNSRNLDNLSPPPRQFVTHNHPFNHPISSTTSENEVIHNPENQTLNSPVGNDLENVISLVSTWEQGRGKTVKISTSDRTKISYWLQVGVSTNALKSAYDTAVAQRQKQGDPAPVTIGYLDSIIASASKAANPTSALAGGNGSGFNAAPWYVTDAGIENEANRIGCKPHPGEPFPEFKFRVLAYRQIPYEQYERDRQSFSKR